MNLDQGAKKSLSGSLLVASPTLRDPNFFQTVLLLAAHDSKEGALGYIINRPLDHTVADLITDSEEELGELGNVPVFLGGPVSSNKLTFLSLDWNNRSSKLLIQSHLTPEEAQQELELGRLVRGFVGYSGWSEGQLENELYHKSWIACKPPSLEVMDHKPQDLWRDILKELGPYYKLLASMPPDVSLN